MSKSKNAFICDNCGHISAKWVGKCTDCHEWNSFIEQSKVQLKKHQLSKKSQAKRISEITSNEVFKYKTNISEFDRVLGGGITPGSLVLIGGEPGIGKSTLLMEVCLALSSKATILYISGEESENQIAARAQRLNINNPNFYLLNENDWLQIKTIIKEVKPKFIVLDSIQTTTSNEISSPTGSQAQVREVTYELMNLSKTNNISSFVIGHVTKDGAIAGPKILEHMVDTVIYFEGDKYGDYRILRAVKNRFGNTNEIGLFEMTDIGLKEIVNPSQYFLGNPTNESPGKSLTCVLKGNRPLIIEIQALVIENKYGNGRRTAHGLDLNRLNLLIAVIEKYLEIPLSLNDVYINVTGGIKINSNESDLSIIAAILSSINENEISTSLLFLGEIGLSGEVRNISSFEQRLKESKQLGYETIITSNDHAQKYKKYKDINLIGVNSIKEIKAYL